MPRVNYKVKADVEQNVGLGDAIVVRAKQFTVNAEVLSFDYDVIKNRVISVEFGNYRPTLKSFFNEMAKDSEEKAVKRAAVKIDEVTGVVQSFAQDVNAVNERVSTAEEKITPNAIINTVLSSGEVVDANEFESFKTTLSTELEQTNNSFNFSFTELMEVYQSLDGDVQHRFEELTSNIRFINGDIHLGRSDSAVTLVIKNNRISFMESGSEVAHISNNTLNITDGSFFQTLNIGNFRFSPRSNGSLSFGKR